MKTNQEKLEYLKKKYEHSLKGIELVDKTIKKSEIINFILADIRERSDKGKESLDEGDWERADWYITCLNQNIELLLDGVVEVIMAGFLGDKNIVKGLENG